MAYATYEALITRYPSLADLPVETVETRLEDATLAIDAKLRGRERDAAVLEMVCCDVAARSLEPLAMFGGMDVSQMSTTVGSISEQFTFKSSGGNCRLLKSDLDNLGIGSACIGYAQMGGA